MSRSRRALSTDASEDRLAADALLVTIRMLQRELAAELSLLQARVEAVQGEHRDRIAGLRSRLEGAEKGLLSLARARRSAFFADRDRLDLRNGSLFERIEQRVRRARGVLEALERLGPSEAIKIAKSVDWDRVGKLSDEELTALGTERVIEKKYTYEVTKNDE